ncbi:hypothetical protein CVT25_011512 [Psilocybe cyanescens]|uniref:Uncharacterized protein n=1 Tax=Psilocybe cyanescens TaxID=93625 RepID=A0A409XUQ3_PSICY|nr:hypothetical protein CVT25_011512 [Psilocybe cyanescens]
MNPKLKCTCDLLVEAHDSSWEGVWDWMNAILQNRMTEQWEEENSSARASALALLANAVRVLATALLSSDSIL